MTRRIRKTFSPEFKREAVRLLETSDKESSQLARELGVRRNQLYKWQKEVHAYGEEAFPGHGKRPRKKQADNTTALKAELTKLREENEILKKAALYFARESG
jgi:transposase